MLSSSEQLSKNTLSVVFKAIQATLTKSIGSGNLNAFKVSPETLNDFDEATTSIITDKMLQKLVSKG